MSEPIHCNDGCDLTAADYVSMARSGLSEGPESTEEEFAEVISDFPDSGSKIADTEPRPVSTSLAVAKRVEASEGPERAGHKPLMRNPIACEASPTGITASDTFSPTDRGLILFALPAE